MQLSTKQEGVLNAVKNGENIVVTGVAGTGKSFLIDKIKKNFTCALTSSTGISAIQIGGTTIHRWSGIGLNRLEPSETVAKILYQQYMAKIRDSIWFCQRLIIDEVSMLDANFIDTLDFVLQKVRLSDRPFGGVQIILCGDFLQLPPVDKDGKARFAFESDAWVKGQFNIHLLTKVFRQENQLFADILGRLRIGVITQEDANVLLSRQGVRPPEGLMPIQVFSTNKEADNYNAIKYTRLEMPQEEWVCMDWFPPEWFVDKDEFGNVINKTPSGKTVSPEKKKYYCDQLDKDCLAPSVLKLRKGAQVMLLKNIDLDNGLANGCMGIVTSLTPLMVKFNNGIEREIFFDEWELYEDKEVVACRQQVPLRLAWGITIHKCQGMTLEYVACDLTNVFETGQAYVALSRAKSLEGLYLHGFRPEKIMANQKALNFYRKLYEKELQHAG